MFDSTIKPVIVYDSENPNYKKLKNVQSKITFSNYVMSLFLKKIHLKAGNNFFGINRRATNLAVVGETGRYPFMFDFVVNMLKYYKRLCTSDDILLRNAF